MSVGSIPFDSAAVTASPRTTTFGAIARDRPTLRRALANLPLPVIESALNEVRGPAPHGSHLEFEAWVVKDPKRGDRLRTSRLIRGLISHDQLSPFILALD